MFLKKLVFIKIVNVVVYYIKKSVIIYKNGIKINVDVNVQKLKVVTLDIHGMLIIVDVK